MTTVRLRRHNAALSTPPPNHLSQYIAAVHEAGLRHPLEAELLAAGVLSVAPATAGANAPRKLGLSNGWTAYFKSFEAVNMAVAASFGHQSRMPPLLEVVAWKLADALGIPWARLVQPVVFRSVDIGNGHAELGSLSLGAYGADNQLSLLDTETVHIAAFWDCLVGQQDRHGGNFKYESSQRRVALYDHGFSFARPSVTSSGQPDFCNSADFVEARHARGLAALQQYELDALERLTDDSSGLGIKPMLPADRFSALTTRAQKMLATGVLLPPRRF